MDPILHAAPDNECRYDAFISYRHLPLDRAVAMRLQTLLENYRPPRSMTQLKNKRIRRVFRDQSELPTSGDLGSDIRTALLSSRYLIVICSEQFRDSVWCMEEVRQFKAAHGGRTDRILTLLVSGEPKDVFPPELTEEVRPGEEGEGEHIEHIEPLSGDVRAPTIRKSLRLLNTEFLRIAAPLLGCGFDDLYQRHLRRRRRRLTALIGGTAGVLGCVLCVVSVFAYRTWVSEGDYRRALATTYLRSAAEYAVGDDPQRALLYYTEALALEPGDATAAAGAATLLQSYVWPVLEGTEPGALKSNGVVADGQSVSNGAGDRFLTSSGLVEPCTVLDAKGQTVAVLPEGYTLLSGDGQDVWTFLGDDLLFYDTGSDQQYRVPVPETCSRGCEATDEDLSFYGPCAEQVAPGRVAVAQGSVVHLYELADGTVRELAAADLADALPEVAEEMGLSASNSIYVSASGSLVAVVSYSHVVVYDGASLALQAAIPEYDYTLIGVSFSADDSALALNYGSLFPSDYNDPVSCFAVYSARGERLFLSPEKLDETILGTSFHPLDSDCLLVWGRTFARVWNWQEGREVSAPLFADSVAGGMFVDGQTLALDDGQGRVNTYGFRQIPSAAPDTVPEELPEPPLAYDQLTLEDGTVFTMGAKILKMGDQAQIDLPQMMDRMTYDAASGQMYVFNRSLAGLWRVPADPAAQTFGELQPLDTDGNRIITLWFGSGHAFAQTAESHILVYGDQGVLVRVIRPQHTGSLQGVVGDPAGTYLAVVLKPVERESTDYHFTESGIIELWNLADGNLAASFENPERKITGVDFTAGGALVWADRTSSVARQVSMPAPGQAVLEGLRSLNCLSLQPDGATAYRSPAEPSLGEWQSILGGWQTAEFEGDEASGAVQADCEELTRRIASLESREDPGSDAWYEEADEIWRDIADGALAANVSLVDQLYGMYINTQQACDPGRLGTGVQAYCDWYALPDASQSDEVVLIQFDIYSRKTLDISAEYDQILSQGIRAVGSTIAGTYDQDTVLALYEEFYQVEQHLLAASAEEQEPLLQRYYELYTESSDALQQLFGGQLMMGLADVLDGRGTEQLSAALQLPLTFQDQGILLSGSGYMALYELMRGNVQEAVSMLDTQYQYLQKIGSEPAMIQWTMQNTFDWISIAADRGLIGQADQQAWLRRIQIIPAYEVWDISTQTQGDGLRADDKVIGINGVRLCSDGQTRRLGESGIKTLTVLRDGREQELTMSGSTTFAYRWTLDQNPVSSTADGSAA